MHEKQALSLPYQVSLKCSASLNLNVTQLHLKLGLSKQHVFVIQLRV